MSYNLLDDLKQGDKTVDEYMQELESLVHQSGIPETDIQACSRLIHGLRPNIRYEVEMRPCETVEEASHHAKSAEL